MDHMTRIALMAVLIGWAGSALAETGNRGPGMMKHMWTMADADKDGRISKAEFTAMSDKRFAVLDANGDGFLDDSEREQAQARMRQHMGNMLGGSQTAPTDP
ncbi:MAG: hypothetical protein WBN85_05635 [Candidatus Macondimonas sp.]